MKNDTPKNYPNLHDMATVWLLMTAFCSILFAVLMVYEHYR